jgi:hypothetical protein
MIGRRLYALNPMEVSVEQRKVGDGFILSRQPTERDVTSWKFTTEGRSQVQLLDELQSTKQL